MLLNEKNLFFRRLQVPIKWLMFSFIRIIQKQEARTVRLWLANSLPNPLINPHSVSGDTPLSTGCAGSDVLIIHIPITHPLSSVIGPPPLISVRSHPFDYVSHGHTYRGDTDLYSTPSWMNTTGVCDVEMLCFGKKLEHGNMIEPRT